MDFKIVNLDEIDTAPQKCVLALGMFDGLHIGHMRVIKAAAKAAKRNRAELCVLTFSPHPSKVIDMGRPPAKMVCPPEQRAELFKKAGVKKVFVKKFTKTFANMTPEGFAKMLVKKFPNLRAIATGYNFLFGRGASGNTKTLAELCKKHGWEYEAVDGAYLGDGRRISASELRKAVARADMDEVKLLTGDFYTVSGRIKSGKKLGRKIGFPTLNIPWNPACKPPFGVYAIRLTRAKTGETFRGVASYGTSPTVGETEPLLEVNLLKNVKFGAPSRASVKLVKFLRGQKKFDSLDALKTQIAADKRAAADFFKMKKKHK